MTSIKHWILFCSLLGFLAVTHAQLNGLARLMAGPQARMLKMLAYRSPALRQGLATLQDMKVARKLGCRPAFDNESPLRALMPSGCTPKKDFCPYTRPMHQCVQVGLVGMCCPLGVTTNTLKTAKMFAKYKKLSEAIA